MTGINPFTQRGRIDDPARFVGRWGELSLLFGALEARRPVFVVGVAGIGKSSLLAHVVQSASINLERFDLRAFSLDLAVAESERDVYRVIIEALRGRGASPQALRELLAESDSPTLLCLDNAQVASACGWGDDMLDEFARMVRAGLLMLVVAQEGEPPVLSERVVVVRLGAFAPSEVRLLAEAYLEESDVVFTPRNMRHLYELSHGHPGYLQRAAFHLFASKLNPEYDWVRAYLAAQRATPIPGAPLPPPVFAGADELAAQAAAPDNGTTTRPRLLRQPLTSTSQAGCWCMPCRFCWPGCFSLQPVLAGWPQSLHLLGSLPLPSSNDIRVLLPDALPLPPTPWGCSERPPLPPDQLAPRAYCAPLQKIYTNCNHQQHQRHNRYIL